MSAHCMATSGPARTRATSVKDPVPSARCTAHHDPGAGSESVQVIRRLLPAPSTLGALEVALVYVWTQYVVLVQMSQASQTSPLPSIAGLGDERVDVLEIASARGT